VSQADARPLASTRLAGGPLAFDDTIVALATPPGRGALAVIRLSGHDALEVAGRVLRPWPLPPRVARLCAAHDPATGERLERPVVTVFEAPRSYTGEHVVEIATHGGHAAPTAVIAALVAAGARDAAPGEFTRRAVLNGKMDLVQAEAVGDLIDARTGAMRQAAVTQLDGGLSRRVAALREALLEVEALVAYDIDFPEEDDGPVSPARVTAAARTTLDAITRLLATAPAAELVRDGATVVLAGAPNAGKSSLFNALAGQARAIVTSVPGTTRDAIEVVVDTPGWPLRLVDTAGLRETRDQVERLGIEVSERYVSRAHVVLACGETPADVDATAAHVARLTSAPVIRVWTKRDDSAGGAHAPTSPDALAPIEVSAERGSGLHALVARIGGTLAEHYGTLAPDVPLLTRARHRRALEQASAELAAFVDAWSARELPAPVAAVHLRAAVHALEELIGAVDVDDVLARLFSDFCVGK
jgi:tRNA modification GTPase